MEDNKQFDGFKNIGMLTAIILFVVDIYFHYYKAFYNLGYYGNFGNSFLNFFSKIGVFNEIYYNKFIIILLSILFVMLDSGKKDLDADKNTTIIFAITSTLLFIATCLLYQIFNLFFYTIIDIIAFAFLINSYNKVHRLFDTSFIKDRYNKVNKIFPQNKELLENDMSVNIPYQFIAKYDKNLKPIYEKGIINFVAPERATLILGKPGSGKSYSFNEEFIRQWIEKGFSFINYDYKFPTLTDISYYYFEKNKNKAYSKYDNGGRFACINIADPQYSDRCNPVSYEILENMADAIDAVYTIFYNLDKKSAQKQDFFQMSAMAITSAALWFLRQYEEKEVDQYGNLIIEEYDETDICKETGNSIIKKKSRYKTIENSKGKYCSFPHLIQLIMQPDEKLLTILDSYPELKYFTASFSDALKKESFEQLSGQTASARIPLGKCATPQMFFVMTDPDKQGVDLRVNKKDAVTVLNIANNPATQKTNAPAIGLYLSQAAKLINAQDRVPCAFHIDEFPTTYINGLDTLIATARSNKVCTVLSAQDYTQLVLNYGKEPADAIYNTIDNIVTGKVAIDTAKKVAEGIGKFNYTTQSVSLQKDSSSTSFNTSREQIVPPEDISQFKQGEFCGIVSDSYKQPIDLKVFRGIVSPPKDDMRGVNFPKVHPNLTNETLVQNMKMIQNDINVLITHELQRLENEEISIQNEITKKNDEDINHVLENNSIQQNGVSYFENISNESNNEEIFVDEQINDTISAEDLKQLEKFKAKYAKENSSSVFSKFINNTNENIDENNNINEIEY